MCYVIIQKGRGQATWELSLGGNPHTCRLTLTIPKKEAFGELGFATDDEIQIDTGHMGLEGRGLSISAPHGITLMPPALKMKDLLKLESTYGPINVTNTEAGQYDFKSESGDITVNGKYPKKDSTITQTSGDLNMTLSGNSGGSAALTIEADSGTAQLFFKGFDGELLTDSTAGSTRVNRTGDNITSWSGGGGVTIGDGG